MIISYLQNLLETHPVSGYFTSATAATTSLIGSVVSIADTTMHWTMACVGLAGMIFGALGGYYTWRIQRIRLKKELTIERDQDDAQ